MNQLSFPKCLFDVGVHILQLKSATNAATDSITYVCRLTYAHLSSLPTLHSLSWSFGFACEFEFSEFKRPIVIIINFILVSCKTICKRTNKLHRRQIVLYDAQMHNDHMHAIKCEFTHFKCSVSAYALNEFNWMESIQMNNAANATTLNENYNENRSKMEIT